MKKLFWIFPFLILACISSQKPELKRLGSKSFRTFSGDSVTAYSWDVYPVSYKYSNLRIKNEKTDIFSESGYIYYTYISDGVFTGSLIIPDSNSVDYVVFDADTLLGSFDDLLFKYNYKTKSNQFNEYLTIKKNSDRKVSIPEKYSTRKLIEKYIYQSYHYGNLLSIPDNDYLRVECGKFGLDITSNKIYRNFKGDIKNYLKKTFKLYNGFDYLKIWYQPDIKEERVKQKGGLMELHFKKMKEKLGVQKEITISVFWFKDQKSALYMLYQPLGFAQPSEKAIFIHDRQSIGHEINHVLLYYAFGKKKSMFLDEGFATFYDGNNYTWEELKQKSSYKDHLQSLKSGEYFKIENGLDYFIAGSIVGLIIEKYGLEKFGLLYKDKFWYDNLEQVLGISSDQLLQEWLSS